MSLFITSLNSGSNGNCYYVGTESDAVLIDAGISCREIEKRMRNLQLSMDSIKALFISHEHSDHIIGARVLSKKYKLPVYITHSTLRYSGIRLEAGLACSFKANEEIRIGDLTVIPFVKLHDATDPYSFMVAHNGIRVGVITDIGKACSRVIHYFRQCHACFLESNYDEKMLEEGGYTRRLKNRIKGGKGHLSNTQALELFIKHRPPFMSHLLLSHLSKNNNHPQLVEGLFNRHASGVNIIIASRYKESAVYKIARTGNELPEIKYPPLKEAGLQLALF